MYTSNGRNRRRNHKWDRRNRRRNDNGDKIRITQSYQLGSDLDQLGSIGWPSTSSWLPLVPFLLLVYWWRRWTFLLWPSPLLFHFSDVHKVRAAHMAEKLSHEILFFRENCILQGRAIFLRTFIVEPLPALLAVAANPVYDRLFCEPSWSRPGSEVRIWTAVPSAKPWIREAGIHPQPVPDRQFRHAM